MRDLSVIIVSYNTKAITERSIESVYSSLKANKEIKYEIIAVDNASNDGSVNMLKDYQKERSDFILIRNNKNLGFAKANNLGVKKADGRYILFLNSDVVIDDVNFHKLIEYLDNNKGIGALTVRVVLPNKQIDLASHRGFPTPWNSFCYFAKLEKLFGHFPLLNKYFGGYHLTFCDLDVPHEINSPSGAFYLTRHDVLKKLGGFDEDFFIYGEDLDLSFRMKNLGYRLIYYPLYTVTHLKYASGLENRNRTINDNIRGHFYQAMKIFYKKHYLNRYPKFISQLVYLIIDLKNKIS